MSDGPALLNRARMAAYLDLDHDAARCREIAAKCDTYGLPHRRIGLIERGLDIMRARTELHCEAFGEAAATVAPFPVLIADPMLTVDYAAHDAELARIEARKAGH